MPLLHNRLHHTRGIIFRFASAARILPFVEEKIIDYVCNTLIYVAIHMQTHYYPAHKTRGGEH